MSSKRAPDADGDRNFAALVAACRSAFRTSTTVPGPADWPTFLQLATYHRVEGQAFKGLRNAGTAMPAKVEEELHHRARRIAAANLRMIEECNRLRRAFDDAGLAILFVKGATLAEIAYGDAALKSASDIDLMIDPESLGAAAQLLARLGYRSEQPADMSQIEKWHSVRKESLWVVPQRRVAVDLHTRLADAPAFLPRPWETGGVRQVSVAPGINLPTLGSEALAAYLAIHGATSAWFRLKWLADFAALIEREHRGRLAELRAAMVALGAQRAGDQALHLADRLFGSLDADPPMRALVGREWRVRAASGIAHSYLRSAREPTERKGGTIGIHLSALLVTDGAGPLVDQLVTRGRMLFSRAV